MRSFFNFFLNEGCLVSDSLNDDAITHIILKESSKDEYQAIELFSSSIFVVNF